MVSAKAILTEMCEIAVTYKLTRIGKTVEGIGIALHRNDFTDGVWTLSEPGKPVYCTHDVNQCEVVLNLALAEKAKAGVA